MALAVAQLIADCRGGGTASVVAVPEQDDRSNPAVELVTADALGTLAIEHTLIEPYPGQIQDNVQISPYVETLPTMLEDRLPVGSRFQLILDPCVVNGIKPTQEVLDAIVKWVVTTAPHLEDGHPGIDGRHMAKGEPPDVPFPITLVRWPRRVDDTLPPVLIARSCPPDLEELRRQRLVTALEKKLPKLTAAGEKGHQGVLVIESRDFALSNSVTISAALFAASDEVTDPLPSWIILWQQVGDAAFEWTLRADGEWIGTPHQHVLPAVRHPR